MSPLPDTAVWVDAWYDALALTEAVRDGRHEDAQFLMRIAKADPGPAVLTMVTLAKLLAEAANEREASPERLRTWAAVASAR